MRRDLLVPTDRDRGTLLSSGRLEAVIEWTAHDAGAFVRRGLNLDQIAASRVVRGGLGHHELDESQDDRELIAQRMHGLGLEPSLPMRGIHDLNSGVVRPWPND
jgi:hypothetical protein